MRYSAVAGRYARALLNVAIENGKEEEYKRLLKAAALVYRKLQAFFDDPTLTSQKKFGKMIGFFEESGINLDESFKNFLSIVFERKRQKYLPLMVSLYEDLEIEAHGKIPVDVITPYELSSEELQQLARFVKKHALREPVFRKKIDESLIAGVKLEFQGMSYDVSIKGRLLRIARDVFGKG